MYLYASDCSYPTKDWKRLGTFHAREDRTIQSFAVKEAVRDMMFSKYLKVTILYSYNIIIYCHYNIYYYYSCGFPFFKNILHKMWCL